MRICRISERARRPRNPEAALALTLALSLASPPVGFSIPSSPQVALPTPPLEVPPFAAAPLDEAGRSRARTALEKVPLPFVANQGQVDSRIAYYLQGSPTSVYLTRDGVVFALTEASERWIVRWTFEGANPDVNIVGRERSPAVVSYFTGDRSQWKTGIPTYGSVVYEELWPGIDLVYASGSGRLKYTFLVKPGADPARIRLKYEGATSVRMTETGGLRIETPLGGFEEQAPYAYQEDGPQKTDVAAAFLPDEPSSTGDYRFGFRVGDFDPTKILVIDPVVLAYAGFIGGAGTDDAWGVAVDSSGNAYVAGRTQSSELTFPVTVGPDVTYSGGSPSDDAFIAKVNSSGTALLYCGYIGGTLFDIAYDVAVDSSGAAYVTGTTASTESSFPVTVGPDLTHNGPAGFPDAWVAKVSPDGTALVYAGYIGGSGNDEAFAIAVDGSGNAYLGGNTTSTEATFPETVGPDLTYNGGTDAWVGKLNATGTGFHYLGYIGGSASEQISGIAVDASGNAYVGGQTASMETQFFPVVGGPDPMYNGNTLDGWVAKVNAAGTALVYCGYVGGAGREEVTGLAVDSSGNLYLSGTTESNEASFPVIGGLDPTFNGGTFDGFVAKLNPTGTTFLYSGYLGGSGIDRARDVDIDSAGAAYVTGYTSSMDFPVVGGPDPTYNGGPNDAYVVRVSPDGASLVYAGYIGGTGDDQGQGIAVDVWGNAYIVGGTNSTEPLFPVAVGPDPSFNGVMDAFIAKVEDLPGGVTLSSSSNQSFTVGGPSTPMATIRIVDGAGAITATNDLRIRIPLEYPMRWDPAFNTPILGGSAASSVALAVKAFEDSGRTVVLDVVVDFDPNDDLTVSGLQFFSFTAPAGPANLELEVGNDGLTSAFDDKTIQISPASSPTLSSDDHQVFVAGPYSALEVPFTVSEGQSLDIRPAKDIRIRIPASLSMSWDTGFTSPSILGPASTKVSPTVGFEDAGKTLVIFVLTNFAIGDYITVSGLHFRDFVVSGPSSLELDVDNTLNPEGFDDKTMQIVASADVPVFTATATDMQVKLEWVYPQGACSSVRIFRDTADFPGPDMGTPVVNQGCGGAGDPASAIDSPLDNGTTYFYSAYIHDGAGYTPGKFVKARPFDTPTSIHWAYSTGATSMAPPGLRIQSPDTFLYVVSNDRILHSLRGGSGGGDWPTPPWKPFVLGGPAQARPPVLFALGATHVAAFLGSQDGRVYAVDAVDGSLKWEAPVASMVQAAPAGHFRTDQRPVAHDLVLVGTRNGLGANSFAALDVGTGNPKWSFVNSSAQAGNDTAIGVISGGAAIDYGNNRAYFASRRHPSGSADTLWCVTFDGTSVSRVWSQPLGDIDGSPVLMNGRVYVGNNAGVLHALDAGSGAWRWSLPLGDGVIKGFPFPRGTNQLFLSTNTKLWSVIDVGDTASVITDWPVTVIPSPSIPLYVPGTTKLLVGGGDGKLYQVNVLNPLSITNVVLGDGSAAVGAPTMDLRQMLVYVGTDAGIVYGVTFPLP